MVVLCSLTVSVQGVTKLGVWWGADYKRVLHFEAYIGMQRGEKERRREGEVRREERVGRVRRMGRMRVTNTSEWGEE